jgi:hypothetical protein
MKYRDMRYFLKGIDVDFRQFMDRSWTDVLFLFLAMSEIPSMIQIKI